jgi:pimeloyl-ACP methyl ester carboxylesterase
VATDFDRSAGLSHSTNHFKVKGGERWARHLPEMQTPTTVLHGVRDPLFPIEHGRALAGAVPHAKLIQLPGGHGLGPSAWRAVMDAITE